MYVLRYSAGSTYIACGYGHGEHFIASGASDCLWLIPGTIKETDEE